MIKNMPNAVNKIQWRREMRLDEKDKTRFEVIIKENGKLVYHNTVYAGVLSLVQGVSDFNPKELSITGDSQVFGFGHPCVQVFALDQLKQKLMKVGVFIQAATIMYKLTHNRALRKMILAGFAKEERVEN